MPAMAPLVSGASRRSSFTSRFGAAPVNLTLAEMVLGSKPGASNVSFQSPDRATTKMNRPRSSVAAVSAVGDAVGVPPVSARTMAPRMGPPVSSRTTPAMRLVDWACAVPADISANAAAAPKSLVIMGEVYGYAPGSKKYELEGALSRRLPLICAEDERDSGESEVAGRGGGA